MECEVSYADSEQITHSVTVSADSLFEACIRALSAFQKSGLDTPGRISELTVKVSQPSTSHTIRLSTALRWLENSGRSPKEQSLKVKLREIVRVEP
jgi:hypothetical protein